MAEKTRVLLIGCGGIGTITALNLEASGQCHVTAVLRSNLDAVQERGFSIDSIDHGKVEGWRPSESTCQSLFELAVRRGQRYP
jgi:ketopantoate reductase